MPKKVITHKISLTKKEARKRRHINAIENATIKGAAIGFIVAGVICSLIAIAVSI